MLQVAICEDNIQEAEKLDGILSRGDSYEAACEVFYTGEGLLTYLERTCEKFQIYFLDIEMGELNGIETAREIRKRDRKALILFLTSHREFVYEAFEVQAFRFLQKPVEQEKVEAAMQAASAYLAESKQCFSFQYQKVWMNLYCDEILYFESCKRKMTVYTEMERFSFNSSVSQAADQLNPVFFVRTHGSYIVNLEQVQSVEKDILRLRNGVQLPVSKNRRSAVKEAYFRFLKRRL